MWEKQDIFWLCCFSYCRSLLLSAVSSCWVLCVCVCGCFDVCVKWRGLTGTLWRPHSLPSSPPRPRHSRHAQQWGGRVGVGQKTLNASSFAWTFHTSFSFCCRPPVHYGAVSRSASFRWQDSQPKQPLFLPPFLCHPSPLLFHNVKPIFSLT